jgi:hypothetical protein
VYQVATRWIVCTISRSPKPYSCHSVAHFVHYRRESAVCIARRMNGQWGRSCLEDKSKDDASFQSVHSYVPS